MNKLMDTLDSTIEAIKHRYNLDTVEHSSMMAQIEQQAETLTILKLTVDTAEGTITKQGLKIESLVAALNNANSIIAQLKEKNRGLIALDAPGAVKRSKGYKKQIEELKVKLADVEGKRKIAQSKLNQIGRG